MSVENDQDTRVELGCLFLGGALHGRIAPAPCRNEELEHRAIQTPSSGASFMAIWKYKTRHVADKTPGKPENSRNIMALETLTDDEIVEWLNTNPEFWTDPGPRQQGDAPVI